MAIVEEKKISSNSGFEKELDDAAVSMIIDNLQIFLYNKPIQACIKETVSNAIDSNKEKIIAKEIKIPLIIRPISSQSGSLFV